MPSPRVSISIPAFNEGRRLPLFVGRLADALLAEVTPLPPVELCVVDDGSAPEHRTAEREAVEREAHRLHARGSPHTLTFLQAPQNGGKGSAIRLGWARAQKEVEWLGFLDADGATPAHELVRLVRMLDHAPFDALAGSRIRMAGRTIGRSAFRHLQGRVFATLVELTFHLGFYDPQCGAKLFRAALLRPELERLREDTWLLDIEALARVQRRGGVLREEPVDWEDPGGSKVSFGIDPLKMALGLTALRKRLDAERQP